MNFAVGVDHGEQISADSAKMRAHHRKYQVRCDSGIYRVAPTLKHADTCGGCKVVRRSYGCVRKYPHVRLNAAG